MKSTIIIGATSGVGRTLAEHLSKKGTRLLIISRSMRDLIAISNNLSIKYKNTVDWLVSDLSIIAEVNSLAQKIANSNVHYHEIFICTGKVVPYDEIGLEESAFQSMINTNFTGIAQIINSLIGDHLKQNTKIKIVILTSIAISRPRGNNIIYSTSKSALDFYCRAAQHYLWKSNIDIKIVRMGYAKTSMTYGKKLLFKPAELHSVSKAIYKFSTSNKRIIYYPYYWKFVSIILNLIPWNIYKRMNF